MSIHPSTTIGAVTLTVADLQRSLHYYQHHIGLRLLEQSEGKATLGAGEKPLLHLIEQQDAKPVQRGRTGLYHVAILTPSRYELARTLKHLVDTRTPIGGSSDHVVSEALYLSDPDGHGIEIYRDRPNTSWPHQDRNRWTALNPFDFEGVLGELHNDLPDWQGIHPDTTMGHIHLHVAHIPAAEHFYCDLLGFDLMTRYGNQASFVAAGGYHHHLGLNVWAGIGAPPPGPDMARLIRYEILLPNEEALVAVVHRLQLAGHNVKQEGSSFFTQDPSQNQLELKVA